MNSNLMTPGQRAIYSQERQDLIARCQIEVVAGEAGTGKTYTLVKRYNEEESPPLVVCPTHRACNVLRERMPHASERIGTLHKVLVQWIKLRPEYYDPDNVIYSLQEYIRLDPDRRYGRPETVKERLFSWEPRVIRNKKGEPTAYMFGLWRDLAAIRSKIFIDESSMCGDKWIQKMALFARTGQLAFFGDDRQLAPVKAKPFWVDVEPTTRLLVNHRQDGPLLATMRHIRNAGTVRQARAGLTYSAPPHDLPQRTWGGRAITIAWTNDRVAQINCDSRHRMRLPPLCMWPGEPLIAVENQPELEIFNNQPIVLKALNPDGSIMIQGYDEPLDWTFRLAKVKPPVLTSLHIVRKNELPVVHLCSAFAITCHSAQGGQWPEVYVVDQSFALLGARNREAQQEPHPEYGPWLIYTPEEEALSWLYTAATRAQETVSFIRA